MRKLILISAFAIVASASAQAGESRGLVLAANEVPAATTSVETAKPVEAPAVVARPPAVQPAAAEPAAQPVATAQPEATPAPEPQKPAAKSAKKKHTWRDDEAKARRIAAKYGVYW